MDLDASHAERLRMLHAVRAIDEMRRDDPDTMCDTDALVARLGWSREHVQHALFDARLAGLIVARATNLAHLDLTAIELKPAGRAIVRRGLLEA